MFLYLIRILFGVLIVFPFISFGQVDKENPFEMVTKKRKKKRQTNHIECVNSPLLTDILKSNWGYLGNILSKTDEHKVQIIYTQINRDKKRLPILTHHSYRLDTGEFFFPASMTKLIASTLAIEKIRELNINGLDLNTRMEVGSEYDCQKADTVDVTARSGYPSIGHYIRKALAASDNPSYDHLYEFLGQQEINERLWAKGYTSARIVARYGSRCTHYENRFTNPIRFIDSDTVIYRQLSKKSPQLLTNPMKKRWVGRGHYGAGGFYATGPMDFTYANCISLKDLHEIVIAITMPIVLNDRTKRFGITRDDHVLLLKEMSIYPRESQFPKYNTSYHYDGRLKFFLMGGIDSIAKPNIRIFNKVGMSHGFLTDCAYIIDFENKIEFFLSATVYVNSDGVLNDAKYDYDTIGLPFMAKLGNVIYDYEKTRKRKRLPTLKVYRLNYSD